MTDNQKVKVKNSRTVTVVMVRCKYLSESDLQFWLEPHSFIFSECKACKTRTDYGNVRASTHYERFELSSQRQTGETYDACYDRIIDEIKANPAKYEVPWS